MTSSFDQNRGEFYSLAQLIEPKLKDMGLQFKHTSGREWVQVSYDPDTGYDETYLHLEVIVPEEGL